LKEPIDGTGTKDLTELAVEQDEAKKSISYPLWPNNSPNNAVLEKDSAIRTRVFVYLILRANIWDVAESPHKLEKC
jgi:hypothetical protein